MSTTDTTTTTGGGVAVLGETPLGSGFMGPQSPPGYSLRITTGQGDRLELDSLVSLSVNRRHTAMSDWSATVPTRPDFDERVLSAIRLSFGDTILFRGRLESIGGGLNAPVVGLAGRGIEADLTRGEVTLDLTFIERIEAIRRVWRQHTGFSAAVIVPDDPTHPARTRISSNEEDGTYSGTPMEVLKQLHEAANMRFTVLHSRPGLNVESYPIGARKRRHDWDVLGGDRDRAAKDYANVVTVTGGLKPDGSGEHYRGVAVDEQEVAAMRARGIGDGGRVVYPIRDPSIVSDDTTDGDGQTGDEKCHDKARSKLATLVDKDTVGGSLDVSPTVAAPGYQYFIEEFGGAKPLAYGEGAYGEGPYGSPAGQYASLEKVTYSISRGEESCGLDLSQREGFADVLEKAYGDGQ